MMACVTLAVKAEINTGSEENEMKETLIKAIMEFADRIEAHYPHTNSVQNTIEKELRKFIKEIEDENT